MHKYTLNIIGRLIKEVPKPLKNHKEFSYLREVVVWLKEDLSFISQNLKFESLSNGSKQTHNWLSNHTLDLLGIHITCKIKIKYKLATTQHIIHDIDFRG